jgi:hypothetical protein
LRDRPADRLTFACAGQVLLALTLAAADDAALGALTAEELLVRVVNLDGKVAKRAGDEVGEPGGGDLLLLLQAFPPAAESTASVGQRAQHQQADELRWQDTPQL